MGNDKEPGVKVDISSPISFKAGIKTELPKESAGRLVDALVDIIRPFTERRGLKADQIRLQREDVAIEITKRARKRLEASGTIPVPPPNKFLVPFLEKASTEDMESDLVDKWAELLVSAASEYETSFIRFSSILSELGSREAKMLERICTAARPEKAITALEDAAMDGALEFFIGSLFEKVDELFRDPAAPPTERDDR